MNLPQVVTAICATLGLAGGFFAFQVRLMLRAFQSDLLRELAEMFLDSLPQQMAELRAAIGRSDASAAQRLAHTLKGAVGTFGAQAAFEAALRMETLARQGDLSQVEPAWAAMEDAFAQLRPALTALAAEREAK